MAYSLGDVRNSAVAVMQGRSHQDVMVCPVTDEKVPVREDWFGGVVVSVDAALARSEALRHAISIARGQLGPCEVYAYFLPS